LLHQHSTSAQAAPIRAPVFETKCLIYQNVHIAAFVFTICLMLGKAKDMLKQACSFFAFHLRAEMIP